MQNIKRILRRMVRLYILVIGVCSGLLLVGLQNAYAANTCIWTGASDSAWTNPSNWSSCGGSVPQAVDTASISSSTNQPTISSDVTITGLTLNSGTTLSISSNTLTVNGNININADGGASTTLSNFGTLSQSSSGTMTLSRTAITGTANINLAGTGTWNIGNLTTSSTTTNYNLANGATYNVAGDIVRTAGTLVPGTSTVVMTGSGKQLRGSGSHTYYNLTISSGSSVSNPSSAGNLTIGKDLTVLGSLTQDAGKTTYFEASSATSYLGGGGTIVLGSVTIQLSTALNAGSQNFTISGNSLNVAGGSSLSGGTGTVTFDGTTTIGTGLGTYNFNNVVINSGKSLINTNNKNLNVSGNWINNGMYTPGTETASFNGTAVQTIGGSGITTFNNLTINNGTGGSTTLNANSTVNGILTLTTDLQTSSGISLTLGGNATCAGTGDVFGTVRRTSFNVGTTYCFGNPNVSIVFSSGTLSSPRIDISLIKPKPANAGFSNSVNRLYSISDSGISNFSATLRFHYLDSELNGNTEGATLALWKFVGANTWTKFNNTNSDTTNNWVENNALTSFSSWVLSNNPPSSPTPIIIASLEAQSGGPDWSLAAVGIGVLGLFIVGGVSFKLARIS